MTNSTLTLYKLIVLYMLNKVDFPLSKAQISDFILGKEYTNFLTLQEVLNDLVDAGFAESKTMRNRTLLTITQEGQNTLSYFENRINPEIIEDINEYFINNNMQIKNELAVQAQYYKNTAGEYTAELVVKDKNVNLLSLSLSVPTEDIASSICANWQKKNESIYQYLTKELF